MKYVITNSATCVRKNTDGNFFRGSVLNIALAVWMVLALFVLAGTAVAQQQNILESVSFSSLPGERIQLNFKFDSPPSEPLAFTIDSPARIVLDFADTRNALKKRSQKIGGSVVKSINTAQAKGRTRAVINLVQLVAYQTEIKGNELLVTIGESGSASADAPRAFPVSNKNSRQPVPVKPKVTNVDFRRGPSGEGRVIVTLSNPNIPVDLREQGGRILMDVMGASASKDLERLLDVLDFATPVKSISTMNQAGNVRVTIKPTGDYEHLAYQSDNIFTVEVRKISKIMREARKKKEFTGDRLSLNFQDIETRAVLQLIADFTGLNLVVSDSVGGNITLRLKNVPWDQALDIILKTRGLAKRQNGSVLYIAPAAEIAAHEKLELESKKQVEDLAPLRTEIMQINYARAADIAALLKAPENTLLSDRGSVTIDARTNILLVQDSSERLAELRKLISRLDIPVRQVLIESRIVVANDDFSKELGVRFGVTGVEDHDGNNGAIVVTGSSEGTDSVVGDAIDNIQNNGQPFPVGIPSLDNRLVTNYPARAGTPGQLALAILGSNYLLDLELSALQTEGRGEVVSNPRVITSDQKTARIEQGVEIPYQEASSSGATSVSFKKAVLSLEVTPHITPDDRVSMDLRVNKDSVGDIFSGVPSIDTREVETQVLVDNGQTVVLGGIFEESKNESTRKVPFLGDLPVLGRLFRNNLNRKTRNELLIFVTPKLIDQQLSAAR